ncbi:MAG: right-handed parallel beta-helix repeat-containing protein [Planctomycetota bacterium]|jgi:hypothetical protein|nr:right-handed parallel beta-helix repeat-containing protein [Planctomycetota bacterium]
MKAFWTFSSLLFIFPGPSLMFAEEKTSKRNPDETFGAEPNPTGDPVGGGVGYGRGIKKRDFHVRTLDELLAAIKKAKAGQVVYVDDDAVIDMRPDLKTPGHSKIVIPGGVTLASGRGREGSAGALLYTWEIHTDPLFLTGGERTRVTGLRLSGPDPERRLLWLPQGKTLLSSLDTARAIEGAHPKLEIDNCELLGWGHSAIYLGPKATDAHIHHNSIHHNYREGKGHGIFLYEARNALIEANRFNWCRHAVAGSGGPDTSCEVRYNLFMDRATGHCFDMRGGRDRDDGTDIAGDWFKIHHNTFRAEAPAIVIRGRPAKEAAIHNNWFVRHRNQKESVRFWLSPGNYEEHWLKEPPATVRIRDNHWGRRPPPGAPSPNTHLVPPIPPAGADPESKETFGAESNPTGDPIGGGTNYSRHVSRRDFVVRTLEELLDALEKAKAGQVVYVDDDARIDLSPLAKPEGRQDISIPGGVTLASGRGKGDSEGGLLFCKVLKNCTMFIPAGKGVRLTGLRFSGPDPERRTDQLWRWGQKDNYYKVPTCDAVRCSQPDFEADNCEFTGWSHSAIYLMKGAERSRIHHCYFHHNQRYGLGYGVCLDQSEALIEANLFNWNRHAIAATGAPGTRYEARYNVVLDWSNGHSFDMHGGMDRGDGTEIAGEWVKIHHNTFRSQDNAVVIRGRPNEAAEIHHNWFIRGSVTDTVRFWLKSVPDNARISRNLLGRSRILAP